MPYQETVWGGLTCHIVQTTKTPLLSVVLCHGFGAPGTDLVPLAEELMQLSERLSSCVQFVFPEAPLSLTEWGYPPGKAWWHLDLEKFQQLLVEGKLAEVRDTCPTELPAARHALMELSKDLCCATGLAPAQCVWGGFSQGAMLSLDLTWHLPDSPAGLVVLSGSLINERQWRNSQVDRRGLPVFQSHGRYDPILPFVTGIWVREFLQEAGCTVEFVEFPGGHEINWAVLRRLAAFLERLVTKS